MTQEISFIAAFTAGFLSFLAPCILPLIPPYFAWISGTSLKDASDKRRFRINLFWNSILLILGFSIVFVILGASTSFLGKFFTSYRLLAQKIGGLIIIVLGLEFIGFLKIFKNYKIGLAKKLFSKISNKTSSFLIGLIFAFAWIACLSPILGSILVLSAFQPTLTQGIILLSFYSLGLAIPLLLVSLFIGFVIEKIKFLTKITKWINLFSGLILIILGILFFTDNYYKIVMWFGKTF